MAKNFKILSHRNDKNLHLKLLGDFDGTSAHELINTLARNSKPGTRIFIHTACIGEMAPFGRETFRCNFPPLKRQGVDYVFTGENAESLGN